jgi:hypothetical protein
MTGPTRIGVGHLDARAPLCFFVPSDCPAFRVDGGDHVTRAVRWALTVLGHGHRGGTLVLLADTAPTALDECLAAAMAVDDAVAGGHRPAAGPGAGLVEHTLRTPQALAALAAATGVTPPT